MSGTARAPTAGRSRRDPWTLVAPLLLGAGAVLVLGAVASGAATLTLVVIVPVVTGDSALFGAGVVCLVAGLLVLPFTLRPEVVERAPSAPPDGMSVGGLLLVGPFPIFFGSTRTPPRWVYRLAAAIGAALFVLVVLLVFAGRFGGGL